jgi:hypothetical protein
MKIRTRALVLLAGFCASISAAAVGPTASVQFLIEDPVTHKHSSAVEARLDEIYDGVGQEVLRSTTRNSASGRSLGRLICYGPDEDRDVAGTWWYVVELDGEPLISESIEIRSIHH